MTSHRLMHALIWLANICLKPLHSAGARNFGDGYTTYTVSQVSYGTEKAALLPDRGTAAEVQIRTNFAS